VVLWAKYSHVDRETELVPLAFSICGKKIFEALRYQARNGEALPEATDVSDPGPDPQERLLNEEHRRRFRDGLHKLSPRCRELICARRSETRPVRRSESRPPEGGSF
jgi:DNA-directed RNA polymerase specialized sigma24 family protein